MINHISIWVVRLVELKRLLRGRAARDSYAHGPMFEDCGRVGMASAPLRSRMVDARAGGIPVRLGDAALEFRMLKLD